MTDWLALTVRKLVPHAGLEFTIHHAQSQVDEKINGIYLLNVHIQLVLVLLIILVLQNYYIRAYTFYIMGNVQSSHDLLV